MNQKLLEIVKKWNIKMTPEYRGFRCADCQKYLHKANHNYLNEGGFKTEVHFCHECQKKNNTNGRYSSFKCDSCKRNIFKAYHIWEKGKGILIETHLCKKCFLDSAKIH